MPVEYVRLPSLGVTTLNMISTSEMGMSRNSSSTHTLLAEYRGCVLPNR
jgi:hypothetical protein